MSSFNRTRREKSIIACIRICNSNHWRHSLRMTSRVQRKEVWLRLQATLVIKEHRYSTSKHSSHWVEINEEHLLISLNHSNWRVNISSFFWHRDEEVEQDRVRRQSSSPQVPRDLFLWPRLSNDWRMFCDEQWSLKFLLPNHSLFKAQLFQMMKLEPQEIRALLYLCKWICVCYWRVWIERWDRVWPKDHLYLWKVPSSWRCMEWDSKFDQLMSIC